jgi:4-amino-4-deoxy-L-arabinose transferase-like glycosyltransferase
MIFSWPFFNFPLTDGDVGNWIYASVDIVNTGDIWGSHDQGHGPLMAWMGAISIYFFGGSYYMLNFFNLLMGLLGIFFTYFITQQLFKKESVTNLATLFMCCSIAPVYLSRTPMYDWPAAVLYFIFAGCYILYLEKRTTKWLLISLISIGIASLLRFSISLGLAGFFMLWLSFLIYKRPLHLIIRDGVIIISAIIFFNFPWLIKQISLNGDHFLSTFIYDNTGRFVKSTRPDATVRKDFYGFPIYVLLGLLPFTFYAVASFFKRDIIRQVAANKFAQCMIAGFLPCLILFSVSGHTKLARYIAYVFPFIFVLLAYLLVEYDLKNTRFFAKCRKMVIGTALLLGGLLASQWVQFKSDAESSLLFVVGAIFLVYGLLTVTYFTVRNDSSILAKHPKKLLLPLGIVYVIFFSIVTYEYSKAGFLIQVDEMIQLPLRKLIR